MPNPPPAMERSTRQRSAIRAVIDAAGRPLSTQEVLEGAQVTRNVEREHDVGAFNAPLPRVRVIPIDEFDPLDFL